MNVLFNMIIFCFLSPSAFCLASEPQDEISQLKIKVEFINQFISVFENKLKELETKLNEEKEKTQGLANLLNKHSSLLEMLVAVKKEETRFNNSQESEQKGEQKKSRTKSKEEKKKNSNGESGSTK